MTLYRNLQRFYPGKKINNSILPCEKCTHFVLKDKEGVGECRLIELGRAQPSHFNEDGIQVVVEHKANESVPLAYTLVHKEDSCCLHSRIFSERRMNHKERLSYILIVIEDKKKPTAALDSLIYFCGKAEYWDYENMEEIPIDIWNKIAIRRMTIFVKDIVKQEGIQSLHMIISVMARDPIKPKKYKRK